jgi:DNA-binding MarR family transcriptional regulator
MMARSLAAIAAIALAVLVGLAGLAQADGHDVAVERIELSPDDPHRGEHVQVDVHLANRGQAPSNDTLVNLTLDGNESVSVWPVVVDLAPGEQVTAEAEWQEVGPGDHRLRAKARVLGDDADPSDNDVNRTVTVAEDRPVDERVQLSPAKRVTEVGRVGNWEVNWTVENLRDRPTSLRLERVDVPDNVTIHDLDAPDLDAGQTGTASTTVEVEGNLTEGDRASLTLGVRDEANATSQAQVTLEVVDRRELEAPDLTFAAEPWLDTALGVEDPYLEASIRNEGGHAGPFQVELGIGEESRTIEVDGLEGGRNTTRVRVGPFTDAQGPVWGEVDVGEAIDEADETNNRIEGHAEHAWESRWGTRGVVHAETGSADPGRWAYHDLVGLQGEDGQGGVYDVYVEQPPANWSLELDETTLDTREGNDTIVAGVHVPEDPDRESIGLNVTVRDREDGLAYQTRIVTHDESQRDQPEPPPVEPSPERIDVDPGNRSTIAVELTTKMRWEEPIGIELRGLPADWNGSLDRSEATFNGTETVRVALEPPASATGNQTVEIALLSPHDGEAFQSAVLTAETGRQPDPDGDGSSDDETESQADEETEPQQASSSSTEAETMSARQIGALAVTGSVAVFAGAVALVERARHRLWTLLTPLYTRLAKEDVLDNDLRQGILQAVREDPGIHYSGLRRELDLNAGALTYHLQVLEREDLVTSETKGRRKLFFPTDAEPEDSLAVLPEPRRRVFEAIEANPGASQTAIARELDVSRQLVHHHVHELADEDLVRIDDSGRASQLYPDR